tara:strand:+ start:363 stop:1289 length:927 start_codon:yes stop_codon:yes gene_type:complete
MTGKDFDMLNEAYVKSVNEKGKKPDFLDADKDGNKKEPMKKALKDKETANEAQDALQCEQCEGTGKLENECCTICEGTGVLKEKATDQRPKDEVDADEKIADSACDRIHADLQEPVDEEEKDQKSKKTTNESINNSNKGNIMSEDKSIFDKLYESVMGEDEDFDLGIPGDDAGLDVGDENGVGDDVTVTLTADQADALKAIVDQLGGDEEEAGDVGEDDPLADTEEEQVEEDVDPTTGKATSDGKKTGHDPSDGGGKTTEAPADALGGKSSGTGDGGGTDEQSTGKDTGEGKKPGNAKGAGKPGSQAV